MLQNTSAGGVRSTSHSARLMIPRGVSYEEAMRQFRWPKPKKLNIGRAVCERHNPAALALIVENADDSVRNWTFGELLAGSSRLANALQAKGVGKGDRVGVFLSQGAELTLCHLAGYRMGAVVLPLFTLFGEEAVEYRLANAEASAVITDMATCRRYWPCAIACRISRRSS